MARRLCVVTSRHIAAAKPTATRNPVALAIRELGHWNVSFDGSDTMQYQPKRGGDWHLTATTKRSRKWLNDWLEGREVVVPFWFFANCGGR